MTGVAEPVPVPGLAPRVRLDLSYDGTAFAGWARQPGQRTVQGVVEEALATAVGTSVPLTVAGRTDAGVHATGQVAHAYLADVPDGLLRRLNGILPADVRVNDITSAPAAFDARFSALSRVYRYRVSDGVPDPLRRHDTLAYPHGLDLERLRAASAALLGEHDFAAYCKRRDGATTVRTLLRLDWQRADVLVATVEADAFCHSMVRSLVGALLAVGDGRRPPDWPAALLAQHERSSAVKVAPAHGLTLVEVRYPPPEGLAARVETTRARRVASQP